MTRGLIFWIIMLVWLVFFLASFAGFAPLYAARASGALEFILFVLLGWGVYGAPVRG